MTMGLFGLGGGGKSPRSHKPTGRVNDEDSKKPRQRVLERKIATDPQSKGRGIPPWTLEDRSPTSEEWEQWYGNDPIKKLTAGKPMIAVKIGSKAGENPRSSNTASTQPTQPTPIEVADSSESIGIQNEDKSDPVILDEAPAGLEIQEEIPPPSEQQVQIVTSTEPQLPVQEASTEIAPDHLQKVHVPMRTEVLREEVDDTEEEDSSHINMDPKNPKKNSATFKVESPSKTLFKAIMTGIVGIYAVLIFGYHFGMIEAVPFVPLVVSFAMICFGGRMLYISTSPLITKRGASLLLGVFLVSGGAVTLAITLIYSFDSLLKFFFVFH